MISSATSDERTVSGNFLLGQRWFLRLFALAAARRRLPRRSMSSAKDRNKAKAEVRGEAPSRCVLVGRLTRSRCLVQADNEKQRRERERREFKEAQELESLRRAFKRMDKKGDGKIDVNELMEELEFLGHKVKPQEAALIIWEVDDDADDCVDWEVSHEPTRARAAASLSSAPALGSAGVSDDVLPDSGRHHRLRASQALQRCAACRGAGLAGTGLAWHGWEAGFGPGAPSLAGVLTAAVDAVPAQWSSS